MTEKLVKTGNDYILYSKDKTVLGITSGTMEGRMLSLKNCEAIANGYDLDDLSRERLSTRFNENSGYHKFVFVEAYKEGFLKAMEILGDKKFSEDDVISMIEKSRETGLTSEYLILTKQQIEWDVVIEMEKCGYCEGCNKAGMLHCAHADSCGFPIETERPKLDADGCLILKRK